MRKIFSQSPNLAAIVISWLVLVSVASFIIFSRQHLSFGTKAISSVMYALLMGLYLFQAQPRIHTRWLSRFAHPVTPTAAVVMALFGLYVLYALLVSRLYFTEALLGLALLIVPAGLAFLARPRPLKLTYPDILLILAIWLPVEFGWLPGLTIPPDRGIATVYHLYAIILAVYLFRTVRIIPDMGYQLWIKRWDVHYALLMSSVFLFLFALPIGWLTGFIGFGLKQASILTYLGGILGTAFFVALPEEILFRGIIQNFIEKTIPGRPGLALAYASVIFGMAHANNNNPPFLEFELGALGLIRLPWVYIILATLAGWFYGKTYQRTNNLAAAALVHTIVDCVWWIFFSNV